MILVAVSRSIIFAIQSFWRNIALSIATIFIIFLALISINFLLLINAISTSAVSVVKDKIDVTIFFHNTVRDDKVTEIKSHLETLPQIENIIYRSPEENLNSFRKLHQNDTTIQEALSELEGNPLGPSLVIKSKELSDYPEILKAIDNPAYAEIIEEKSYDDQQIVIDNINAITQNVKRGGFAISGIFMIILVLIVFNTVRIAIFTKKNEVGIMKLVGATNWFVRAPFIIESVISAILGCALSIAGIYLFISFIQPRLTEFFSGANFDLTGYFNSHFLIIFGLEMAGIIILNIISSAIALGKYLKV